MSRNPYQSLADHHFWRRAVAGVERFRFDPVVSTRFTIAASERVATAGSCFAQHISNRLARIGFNYHVVETGEHLPEDVRKAFNYGVFSARYGNVYTSRQLLQLFESSFDGRVAADGVWQRPDGRFVDALRPQIEPEGFASAGDVDRERSVHLAATRRMFEECDVFVFTLGLTETWRSRIDGTVYPLAPGVAGGTFDPARHEFVNLDIHDVLADMRGFLARLRSINPAVKVILTVSPVPLIATFEERHVLVATNYSKSVLRVAADMLYREFDWVEYFPSYEIIVGNYNNSVYFDPDYRGINAIGVDHAMRCFLDHYVAGANRPARTAAGIAMPPSTQDVVCDEEAIDQIRI
jgi:hypothetical protein